MNKRPGFVIYGLLIAFALGSMFPLYWSFLVGSHLADVMTRDIPPLLPGGYFFENASRVFGAVAFWKALANSLMRLNRHPEARDCLESLPDHPQIVEQLIRCCRFMGDREGEQAWIDRLASLQQR